LDLLSRLCWCSRLIDTEYLCEKVDGQFQTSSPGVYAIGDVAAFPLKVSVGNHYSHSK
jgi:pyruvate/2-oxoglutarate dehydrogenase complex dihydrolipoamide dehydrogenase (E3) component